LHVQQHFGTGLAEVAALIALPSGASTSELSTSPEVADDEESGIVAFHRKLSMLA